VMMPGELLHGERFGPVRILSAAEIMSEELSPVRWVVPDILPEGVTFLAGKPKMGKSWMGLDLGIAIATGGVALGTKQVEQGDVLYLALEDNRRRIHNRLGKLLAGRPAPARLHITTEWPRLDEGGADLLDDWVAVHSDARLVIVDTLAMLKPRTNGRRTQYDEDREAVAPLAPIAADHGVAILLVHHLREAESDDPLDMIHGSAGLTGGVDGALVLKRKRGQADAYLHVDGGDIENPTELALKFDQNAATWAIVGDAEEYRLSEQRRAIIRVLESADEPLSPKEITEILNAKGINISYGAVRELVSQMVKDGQVKNLGRGQYVLPDNSQNSADNADILTNGKGDVSLSGMSGNFRNEGLADSGGVE
jgi:AAA domain/Ribonuclease R winged-helix domain